MSFVAFSESAQAELLSLVTGDAVAIAGSGRLTAWTGKDGIEKHGLSVVADQILPHAPPKPTPKTLPESASRGSLQELSKGYIPELRG